MESGIGGLIVFNLILSFTIANISVGAHIGGLIGGALAALAIRSADDASNAGAGLCGVPAADASPPLLRAAGSSAAVQPSRAGIA